MRERSWEYVGRSVEEATRIALEELGLERDDIHVEILEEPQKGFLGLGGKEARIRVELIGEWEIQGQREDEQEVEMDDFEEEDHAPPTSMSKKPKRMVEEILERFEIDAMVDAKERDDAIVIDVWGEDVAILIGRGGNTLDALQYLVNVGCRRSGEIDKRIIVDIEGYRKRKKARIEKQAAQAADKVRVQSRSIRMSPMSAADRKTVHMTIKKMEGVWTESEGDGSERCVVIHPGSRSST